MLVYGLIFARNDQGLCLSNRETNTMTRLPILYLSLEVRVKVDSKEGLLRRSRLEGISIESQEKVKKICNVWGARIPLIGAHLIFRD